MGGKETGNEEEKVSTDDLDPDKRVPLYCKAEKGLKSCGTSSRCDGKRQRDKAHRTTRRTTQEEEEEVCVFIIGHLRMPREGREKRDSTCIGSGTMCRPCEHSIHDWSRKRSLMPLPSVVDPSLSLSPTPSKTYLQ